MELIRVIRAKPRIMEFDKLRQILQCHSMVSKMTPSDLHMRGTVSYGIHCSRKFILAGSQQENNVHLIDILNVALSLPDLQNDLGVGGLLLVLNHPSWVCSCKIFSNGNLIAKSTYVYTWFRMSQNSRWYFKSKIPHITYMNKMVLLFCYDHIAVRPKIPSVLSIFFIDWFQDSSHRQKTGVLFFFIIL